MEKDGKEKVTSVTWKVEMPDEELFGTYFLRTNVKTLDEKTAWDYYNLIREIECSNRQLKTDLNLRPIYHQKDKRSDAHLFFGLLAYWIVNIIRHQLKKENEKRKNTDPVIIAASEYRCSALKIPPVAHVSTTYSAPTVPLAIYCKLLGVSPLNIKNIADRR